MDGSLKTKRAFPIRTRAPCVSRASVVGSPFTSVPFVEPRSRTVHPFTSFVISAWCPDAIRSSRTIVFVSRRPRETRLPVSGTRSPFRSPDVYSRKQAEAVAPSRAADDSSSNRIRVSPTSITSPWRRVRRFTGSPLTRVPLVDPRSATSHPFARGTTLQWCREALASVASTTVFPGSRPTEIASVGLRAKVCPAGTPPPDSDSTINRAIGCSLRRSPTTPGGAEGPADG